MNKKYSLVVQVLSFTIVAGKMENLLSMEKVENHFSESKMALQQLSLTVQLTTVCLHHNETGLAGV